MYPTRIAIAGVALLIGAASPAYAQHRAPRWGGGGIGASAAQQPYPYVVYWGPVLVVPAYPLTTYRPYRPVQVQSRNNWNDGRTGYTGASQAQARQAGGGVSAYPGYAKVQGQPAQVAPARPAAQAPKSDQREHHPQITWPQP